MNQTIEKYNGNNKIETNIHGSALKDKNNDER